MAARATAFTATGGGIEEQFGRLAQSFIAQGNLLADERLWEVLPYQQGQGWTIRSTQPDGFSMHCAFDLETGCIKCEPEGLVFQLVPGSDQVLRRGDIELRLDEAVNLILDQLVWRES